MWTQQHENLQTELSYAVFHTAGLDLLLTAAMSEKKSLKVILAIPWRSVWTCRTWGCLVAELSFNHPLPPVGREIQTIISPSSAGPYAEAGEWEPEEGQGAGWWDPPWRPSVKGILHTHFSKAAPPLLCPRRSTKAPGQKVRIWVLEMVDVNNWSRRCIIQKYRFQTKEPGGSWVAEKCEINPKSPNPLNLYVWIYCFLAITTSLGACNL